jgi:hypothetical protein
LAILIPTAVLLLLCGGVLALVLFSMWGTARTEQLGGPVAIVEKGGPPPEMDAHPLPVPAPWPRPNPPPVEKKDKPAEAKVEPKPVDWRSVGNSRTEGDLKISLSAAIVGKVWVRELNRPLWFNQLCIRLRVENTSATKVIRWRGWLGKGSAQDEHGNAYKPDPITAPYQFEPTGFLNPDHYLNQPNDPHNPTRGEDRNKLEPVSWTGDDGCRINPGKVYIANLFFEAPPPVSKEIRLTLPASVLDRRSDEQWLFRLPIERLE